MQAEGRTAGGGAARAGICPNSRRREVPLLEISHRENGYFPPKNILFVKSLRKTDFTLVKSPLFVYFSIIGN